MPQSVAHARTAEAAALPFRIAESMGVGCGYERSFRLSRSGIDANRYLLGVNTSDTTPEQWRRCAEALAMPPVLAKQFHASLDAANLVFIGFEAGNDGGTYKLYLEFWEQLLSELKQAPDALHRRVLHLGFKWKIRDPDRHVVTTYLCSPRLSHSQITSRIDACYAGIESESLDVVLDIHHRMTAVTPDRRLIYVDAGEEGNPRRSFDINYYAANRRVADIADPLLRLSGRFFLDPEAMDRLMELTVDKTFGHLSAGIDRHGGEYLTVYYEA